MAKQLNVNLAFTADTAKAKAQIAELYKTLNQVSAGSTASPNLFDTQKLKEGVTAAKELQQHLNAAVDVNTGKLNLSAFSASLKSSGKSLADYKAKLEALGPAGENAFLQVSRSIATADAPLRKTSSLLREFSTTMKNTARWQLSSSILHGFMGAVQSAVGYTQDLNESLNNIRIVTGNNTEEMAKFAKEANRAAKALSTTTTEYTNASLIYYQQGLNEQQVKERTDITIKMANVARESAETVSDQLTAVWNNFYENGSQPLEHYADAMTALGAATASSTDEIAGGLEKFASIADMIGLSFDNAAAALATITATTRQSEEVVGTALKTIFARIQGLSLGETLEDGTNLNKYSEALNKVGISIYDAAGGLKDMDNILAEMGAKWETLNKDQQVALAQTVAGVRQYNQLVSLMDNFDFYEQNLMTAQTSDGALNAQAEIYAESWEAARDRVTAAAENIYDSLLDDKFFIKLTDGFGTLLEGVGGFVDGLGGMEGVLSMLGGFITQKLAKEAPAALETIKQNLMQISGKAHEIANQTQKNNIVDLKNEAQSSMSTFRENEGSLAYAAEASVLEKIATLKNQLNNYQNQYSEAEIRSAQAEIDHLERTSELLVKKGERYDSLNSEVQQLEQNISQAGADYAGEETSGVDGLLVGIRDLIGQSSGLKTVQSQISNLDKAFKNPQVSVQDLAKQLYDLSKQTARTSTGDIRTQWRQVAQELAKVKDNANLTEKELKDIINNSKAFSNLESDIKKSDNALTDLVNELKAVEGMNGKAVDQFVAKLKEMGIISSETQIGLRNVGATFEGLKPHVASASEAIMSFSGTLMQANAFINSMTSLGTVFKDEDATTIEKLGAVVGALTSAFMMFNAVSKLTTTLMALQTGASKASSIALFLQAAAGKAEALATMQSTGQKGANIAATIAQTAANWGLNASMAPVLIVTLAIVAAFTALALIIWGVTAAIKAFEAASPEGQLKAAEEEARAFAEALDEAKQEAEDLKNAFDEYDSIQDELDKCTKGTKEWTEALLNANNQVLQLMSDYPELAGMINEKGESAISTDKDGRLQIADWAMESLQNQADQKVATSQGAYFAAQNVVRDKKLEVQKSNVRKDMADDQYATFKYDTEGTNVASYVSSLILKNQKDFEGKNKDDIAANLQKLFDDNGIIASVDSWTDVVLDTQDDFATLNATVEANTAAVKAQNEALMASYLADNATVQNSEYKEQVISASAEKYDAEFQKSYDKWVNTNLAGWFGVGTDAGKEMAAKYAETAGLQGFKVTNYRNDQTIDYTYQQEDGTTSEEINISVEAMAEIIAASEALAAVGDNAEALTAKFNQLYTSTDLADHALADFVAYSNVEDATATEVKELQSAVNDAGGAKAYLESKLGADNVTDEMVANLENSLATYEEMVASVGSGMLKAAKESFDELDTDSLSIAGKEAIANTLEQALVYGGEQGLENAQSMISQLSDEDLGEFSEIVSGIDWQTMDVDSLNGLLQEAGITTEFTADQLNTFIESMRETGIATTESLTSRYGEVTKITNGLETGDTISQEDYATLGEDYQGYFQMMLDGTYKLVGSAEDFQNAVRDIEVGKFQEAMSQMSDQNAIFQKLQGYDIEDLKQSQNYVNDAGENKYNTNDVNKQLEVLEAYGYDAEQIAKWKEDLADNGTTVGVLEDIAVAVNEVGFSEESLTQKIQENNEAMAAYDMAIANSYTNLTDLKAAYDEGTISAQAFNTVAMQLNEAADTADLDSEEWADYADHIQEAADGMAGFNSEMTDEQSKIVAKGIMKMNDGVEELADNFEDWRDILDNSTEASEEYSKAMKGTQKAVSKLLDVSEDYVSDDFVKEHLEEIEKAATGDAEAIDALKAALAQDIIAHIVVDNGFSSEKQAEIIAAAEALQASIPDIKVGASIDTSSLATDEAAFLEQCNKIIADANMTADQANAYFDALGFETTFVTEPQVQTQRVPEYVTETIIESESETADGKPITTTRTRTYQDGYYEAEGTVDAIAMATSTDGSTQVPQIQSMTKKATGSSNNYSSSNSGGKSPGSSGGGGSKKPTADARQKKSDVVERYKEINDELDDMADALDDVSKAADRLYGSARLKEMEKVSKNLEQQIELLKEKKKQAEENLASDKLALDAAAAEVGLSFEYAGNNIINYTEQMTDLYNRREALLDTFGEEISEEEQKKLDALDKKIEEFEKALGLYEETKELIEDIENEIDDAFYEWQDNNYEMLSYKLELEIEINDAELQKLDYLLNKYSDDFYKMAESAVLMNDKIEPTKENLADYRNHQLELDRAYAAGEISQADYIEGLKEVRDGYYENLEALIELDKQMMHYLEDTLSAASEEVADFTDHMEHLTGVFDHYVNLMDILGKSKDYNAMGNFLGGKADTIRDRLTVAQEYYNMLKENSKADEYWANYQAALAEGDTDMASWWKEQWDAEVDALDEAQEEMLSLTEEWAEAMKAVVENNMAQLTDNLEKSLTNGLGFDKLMDDFDKLNTRQEEFLTKTNQIYETNKLMRTANKALDETDNSVAKQKLKNFIEETKSLQENTKLSKYELEIQQAKYDLLLAEIALEEAQNAKSTVRLSRDSEGNFGYVYTADQDAVSDAQQGVDDAENNLYNIALEGQQEYTEKYLQSQQQMLEDLDELWRLYYEEGAIDQEEYNRRYAEIQAHYFGPDGVLTTYSNLYNIGVQTDADATADNWQKNYGAMTQDTALWATNVNTYYQGVQDQITLWESVSVQANSDVKGALTDSETATKNLKDESSNLATALTEQVIPAIDAEIESVMAQTEAYAAQREELLALIAEYEKYIDAINQSIAAQAGVSTNDHLGFDPNVDYSALMNEYLNKGGTVGDASYTELRKQRDAKIAWLQTDAGGNKTKEYWGTSGSETDDMYKALAAGGSYTIEDLNRTMGQDWFTADYVADEELAGIFEDLGVPLGAIEEKIDAVKEATDKVSEKIDSAKEDTGAKLDDANSKADDTNSKLDDANSKADDTNSKLDDSNSKADDTNSKLDDSNSKADDANSKLDEANSELEGANSTLNDVVSAITTASGEIQGAITSAAGQISSSVGGAIGSLQGQIAGLQGSMTALTAISALDALIPFASGGYTGDWGPEGKLAVLHEKELVLNQGDTANLLTTMSFLKDIVSVIDSQASMASMFSMSAMSGVSSNNETLEQMVTIHAEFPNATNHSEIEEAFNNLVNRASQYANRK